MPFHLDPLSRRRFLQGTSALLLSPVARAAESNTTETWALLADTHIAADATLEARGVNMAENLGKVVKQLVAEKDTLSGVVIDGDCAYNDGQPGDYETLFAILAPLREAGLPIHLTLGNHDDRAVLSKTLTQVGDSPVEGKHCTIVETPIVNLVLLDSLRFVNKVEGEIGPEQIAWVTAHLDSTSDKPSVLVGHHSPQPAAEDPTSSDEPARITGLIDTGDLFRTLAPRRAAKAYVYGHSHRWESSADKDGIHHVNLPPTAYVFDGSRPNGWVRATFSATSGEFELVALDPSHPQHGEQHTLKWR
ncbi:MAG: metallophosphoesterase [Verrucomicrobiae bacterium]|nr:metallophosphoesterase [Verrucomicrobiae bacterium]